MSFEKMGIDRGQVQEAIDWTKSLTVIPSGRAPSQNTYVLCPIDRTLWDLKIVVDRAMSSIPVGVKPREWVTQTYEPDLGRLGFDIIKFKKNRSRILGVRGCDPMEIDDPHEVVRAGGRIEENGLVFCDDAAPNRRQVCTDRFVRNSEFVKEVRTRAKGRCECCHTRTFRNALGEWFLEVHHKVWLSEGGIDEPWNMVALCPNCHRREHFGVDRKYGLS
ncbi:HNH endonuclease signature motif containing protein [Ruegeria sp. HKCCD8929]|uniref:HNH endonuclease n=1 Tax=Ruegeria sp. HKCCD8929 TaxID=2683006 RepID=UPI00148830C6|nr:HNH endonuclease signature motif containing protein [Ruegeria sp. HKCCD8929]